MRERQRNYGRPQEPSSSQYGRGGPAGYSGGRGRGRGGYQNDDSRNYGRDQNYGDNRANNPADRNPYERQFHRSDPRQYQSRDIFPRDQNSRRPEPPREEYNSRTPQAPPRNPPPVLLGEFKPSEVRQETLSAKEQYRQMVDDAARHQEEVKRREQNDEFQQELRRERSRQDERDSRRSERDRRRRRSSQG